MVRATSQAWRDELDRGAFKWAKRAQEAGFGTDVAGFQAELVSKLEAWIGNAEIRRRMKEPSLIAVLESRRFQLLAETVTSSSGVEDPNARADDEYRIFGIELDAPATERLIYCYLDGSDESGALADQYGPIVVRFHDRVRPNATFVLGDTRDATLWAPVFGPVTLLSPSIDAFSNAKRDISVADLITSLRWTCLAARSSTGCWSPADRLTRASPKASSSWS